ncbi:biotin--[acetyl-CoA-carboxylase] ligase [Dissulfurispira thermophila]|nr:biotin--[acetyl-CoA-carboxylase] ligase [Dissulfurispira thermophila]
MNNNEEIIKLLKKKEDFISGAEIANTLKITRTAVWKRINFLRNTGYIIDASTRKGYKLLKSPDLSIEEIKSAILGQSNIIGKDIIFFDTIESTNTYAMKLADTGCPEGTVIIADAQTGGKGRLGRKWLSPHGKNLYMSVVLKPAIPPKDASLLTLMSAVACASAIKQVSSLHVSIKWPNDIMTCNKKLGGILTEIKADMDRIFHAVIGIGININLDINDIPDEIRTTATSIKIEQDIAAFSRSIVTAEIIKELDRWYSIFLQNRRKAIIKEWLKLSSTIGRVVKVTVGANTFTGIAETIDEEGMLILRLSDNTTKKISAGDVTILR